MTAMAFYALAALLLVAAGAAVMLRNTLLSTGAQAVGTLSAAALYAVAGAEGLTVAGAVILGVTGSAALMLALLTLDIDFTRVGDVRGGAVWLPAVLSALTFGLIAWAILPIEPANTQADALSETPVGVAMFDGAGLLLWPAALGGFATYLALVLLLRARSGKDRLRQGDQG